MLPAVVEVAPDTLAGVAPAPKNGCYACAHIAAVWLWWFQSPPILGPEETVAIVVKLRHWIPEI